MCNLGSTTFASAYFPQNRNHLASEPPPPSKAKPSQAAGVGMSLDVVSLIFLCQPNGHLPHANPPHKAPSMARREN